MKSFDLKKVMSWLGFLLRCPICGHKYNLGKTKIIESDQDEVLEAAHILVHSDCQKCKSSVIFNIEIDGPEVMSAAIMTDLTGTDSKKFRKVNPISAQDVLDLHSTLKDFDGNFVKAFSKTV